MLALVAVFASVALLTGAAASAALSRTSAGRRRLFALQMPGAQPAVAAGVLADSPNARAGKLSTYVPKSPKEMTRLQRRLAEAGFHGFTPVLVYAFSEIALAAIGFLTVWSFLGL